MQQNRGKGGRGGRELGWGQQGGKATRNKGRGRWTCFKNGTGRRGREEGGREGRGGGGGKKKKRGGGGGGGGRGMGVGAARRQSQ